MAFNQQIIDKVKEKAAFRCCRCQEIGIEAHHILPQKDKGPDTFENAAPLCPNCHSYFGDNPIKRKEITQMRDWWYKVAERRYLTADVNYGLLNEINSKVEAITTNQDKALVDLKETLKKVAFDTIDQMTAGTARVTASGIANASVSPSPSPSPSFAPDEDCYYCRSGLVKFGEVCPSCGEVCTSP
ncbi:MAG: HNH endonuclease [Patescibacteria group bacterium]|nr:HNH endonuclease [Patescibacteria group bacterium]